MWVLTQYIGYDGDEELYVVVPHDTVETEEEAKAYNLRSRQLGSGNLRFYHEDRLPDPNSLPPGRIITEAEAEAWEELRATFGPL